MEASELESADSLRDLSDLYNIAREERLRGRWREEGANKSNNDLKNNVMERQGGGRAGQ